MSQRKPEKRSSGAIAPAATPTSGADERERPAQGTFQEAEEQLRATLESIGDGLFACDQDWRFVYVNGPAERILGIRREEVLGKSHWEVFPLTLGTRLEEEYRRAAAGEARDFENFYEPWGRWFHNRCFPRRGGGMSVYFQDVTDRKRAEAERERLLAERIAVMEGMTDALILADPTGRVIYRNPASLALHGCSALEATSVSKDDALDQWEIRDLAGRPVPVHEWPMPRALCGDIFSGYELRVRRRDTGTEVIVSCNGRLVRDSGGAPLFAMLTVRDVTARRQVQEALTAGERKYRELLETANSIVIRWDNQGIIRFINQYGQRFFGYSADELLGRDVLTIVPKVEASTGRNLNALVKDIVVHPEQYTLVPSENIRKDGTTVWVTWTNKATLDERGNVQEILAIGNDITALKHAEQALRESENRLRSLFESNPDAVFLTRPDGSVVAVNPSGCAMFGYSEQELCRLARSGILDESDPRFPEALAKRRQSGRLQNEELTAVRKNGERFPVEIDSVVLPGEPTRSFVIMRDISDRKRAEGALRESERRFRLALQNAPVSVTVQDRDLRYIWAYNQRTIRPEEIIGRLDSDIFTPEEAAHITAIKRRVLEENIELREQMWLCRPSGRIFLDIFWEPIRDETGKPIGVGSATVDLTPMKLAEEALRESEDRFRTVIENSRDGINMLDLATGRYVFMSPAQVEMTGFTAEELSGLSAQEASERVHPDDRELSIGQQEQVAAGHDLPAPVEYRWKVKSGEYRWFSDSRKLVRDIQGRPVALVGVSRDITEQKRVEEALRQSEARYRMLHENLRDAFVQVSMDGRIIEFNDAYCQMLGYSPEEMHALTYQELTPERWHEFEQRLMHEQIIRRGYSDLYEKEYRRKDGTVIPVELRTILSRDSSGQPNAMWAIVRDISERKRAEKALRDAKDALEHRVAERTGELRQTVEALQQEIARRESAENVLRERSEQLRALASELTLAEQRERRRLAEVLHDELQQLLVGAKFRLTMLSRAGDARVKQLADEVEDLLHRSIECSRTLTGELSPPILHHGGLLAALEWLVVWMQEKHALAVDLQTDGSAEPGSEEMRVLLFQSARELLFNAAKHAKVSRARVCLERRNEHIVLTVADDGVGFDPDAAIPRAGRPGGFGLFSIRERLSLLAGQLEIDSAPDRGSRFRMLVPDVRPTAPDTRAHARLDAIRISSVAKEDREAASSDAGSEQRLIRVMLVDDHVLLRQGLSLVLRAEPDIKIVAEASDGQTAVDLVRRTQPDVVLMDINMPGMDGIEATRRIRAEYPQVQVIGLSMFEEGEPAATIRQAGAVDFLTKSGPAEGVLAAIRACSQRT